MIEDGMEPAGKVGTMVRRLVMESPEFAALPEGRRRAIELRNVLKGTEWGREGVARRLASLTLDSVAKVRAVLDAIRRTPSAIWPISPTSWGSSGWSRSPSGQASLRSAFFPLVTLVTLVASFSPRFARRFFLSSLSSLSSLLLASLRSAFFSVLFSASLRSASMRFSRRKPKAMSPMGIMSPMSPMSPMGKNTQNNTK